MDLVLKISAIKAKDDKYYLFKGIIQHLNPNEVTSLVLSKAVNDSFKKDLVLRKILADLGYRHDVISRRYFFSRDSSDLARRSGYLKLFKELLILKAEANTYRFSQTCSKFLYAMFEAMPINYKRKLIESFLNSEFSQDHKRVLEIFSKNWDDCYSQIIIQLWKIYGYDLGLELLINRVTDDALDTVILDSIHDRFKQADEDGEFDYDYKLRKLRNKFYSRFFLKYSSEIERLKIKEPISFIDICRGAGKTVGHDFALKVYQDTASSRRYLPNWFAEMGMLDVLEKLVHENEICP